MIIKAESHKIFSEIYCPIMPAPLELFFGDGCRSVDRWFVQLNLTFSYEVIGNCKGKLFSDASAVGDLIIRVIIKV